MSRYVLEFINLRGSIEYSYLMNRLIERDAVEELLSEIQVLLKKKPQELEVTNLRSSSKVPALVKVKGGKRNIARIYDKQEGFEINSTANIQEEMK